MESLALTVEEMINVRRVLVKAEMEKFLQSKELYTSLKKGKVRPERRLGLQWGGGRSPGQAVADRVSSGSELLLLPNQVYALLLAPDLPLLQEVSKQAPGWRDRGMNGALS